MTAHEEVVTCSQALDESWARNVRVTAHARGETISKQKIQKSRPIYI